MLFSANQSSSKSKHENNISVRPMLFFPIIWLEQILNISEISFVLIQRLTINSRAVESSV